MGDHDELIEKMWGRIHQARRLASLIYNQEAREMLPQMADEGEADVRRLEAERDAASD
jgi:hypothetical protein